jgi:hypothetical protein
MHPKLLTFRIPVIPDPADTLLQLRAGGYVWTSEHTQWAKEALGRLQTSSPMRRWRKAAYGKLKDALQRLRTERSTK